MTVEQATCEACEYRRSHPHWPHPDMSHCRDCHATWRVATRTIHCVGCHETFTTPNVLELHKEAKTYRCLDPATVTDKHGTLVLRVEPNAAGTPVWRSARERPDDL